MFSNSCSKQFSIELYLIVVQNNMNKTFRHALNIYSGFRDKPMAFFPRIKYFLLLIFFSPLAFAQKAEINRNVFNSDPVLYNGRFYFFFPPPGTEGNPFLTDRNFLIGTLRLKGIDYKNLMLNYDIFNQQLIMKYEVKTGASLQIIVSDAWLETFSFNGMKFEFLETDDGSKKIFQVIGKGPYHVLYFRRKKIELSPFHGSVNHMFSAPLKEMNLLSYGMIRRYHNNRTFCSLFDPAARDEIKDYLRELKINVKKADDDSIAGLITFCNSILEK